MKENIKDKLTDKKTASGKLYCVRLYKAGPKRDHTIKEEEKIQRNHLRYLKQLRTKGKLLFGGPVIDDPELKGIGIFNSSDKEEVQKLSDADPAVKAGRLVYEVYLWFGVPVDSRS